MKIGNVSCKLQRASKSKLCKGEDFMLWQKPEHHEHRCGPPRIAGQFPKDKASIKMHAFVLLGNISLYEKLSACRSSIYCKAQLYCSRNMWNIQSNQILHSADQCFNSSGWLRACELPPRVAARSQLSPRFV